MTREEKIEILKQYREKPTLINEIESVDEAVWLDESLDAAIKALEQEPCDDAISRQAVLKYFDTYDFYKKGCMKNYVKSLPPVQPKPKTGHWEVVSDGYGDSAYICECSECKDTVWVYKDADRKWNYCPNCGADMRGSENENN